MITLYNKYKEKGLTSDEVRQAAKRDLQPAHASVP